MQYCSLQHQTLLPSPVTSPTGFGFALALSLHSLWIYFSTDLQYYLEYLPSWGLHLSVSYLFAFSYCPWGSQGKNTELVCHSLLQWTNFVRTLHYDPSWVALHCKAHSYIELDKAVVHVIRLVSFLSLWFSVCLPSDGEG